MAKSKKARAKRSKASSINWGGPAAKGTGPLNIAFGAVAALGVAGLAAWWWQGHTTKARFLALAQAGRPALEQVETQPNLGRSHLQAGETHNYAAAFPTSGPHSLTPTKPGVYDKPQPPTMLVHALEHGDIVIYYDKPPADVMTQLEDWAGLYTGQWAGVILAPGGGLGEGIVLIAWRKVLTQDRFDAAAAAAFIDEFRGRGPEHPVR
jgi:hypothetical protein